MSTNKADERGMAEPMPDAPFDELVDDLVGAQDVNNAGFYTHNEVERRAARRAVLYAYRAAFNAGLERGAERVEVELSKLGGRWSLDSAYLSQAIAAIRAELKT